MFMRLFSTPFLSILTGVKRIIPCIYLDQFDATNSDIYDHYDNIKIKSCELPEITVGIYSLCGVTYFSQVAALNMPVR